MLNKNIMNILLVEDDAIEVMKFNRVISLLNLDLTYSAHFKQKV
jgi:hypothetical protein